MRIPHHLVRARSGLWSFRQRVPTDLQALVGKRILKRTLRTFELSVAQLRALTLAARYAQAFSVLRERRMGTQDEDIETLLARLTSSDSLQQLTLNRTRTADGVVTEHWQIDTPEDVKLYQQIMELSASRPSELGELIRQGVPPMPEARRVTKPAIETITLGKAKEAWLASIKGSTLPKTWTIKRTAVELLTRFLGEKAKLHTLTRSDLARWYQHMRDEGASTPTLTNKQSYVGGRGGFFEWAIASGHYPKGDNPASGHVSYSTREKRARRKFGFKAYDTHQVQALFAPAAFEALPLPARWAALLGLYTGARASEVGQLMVSNISEESGVPCIHITDEGEHQRVKTDVSVRTVPVHPDLAALGFLEWVESMRAEGHTRLFPGAKAEAKNGQGNWVSKAFSRYLAEVGKNWPTAKRGFHSLRKTLIQELQGLGVVSELRAQIVGHELDDEHHATYSRDFTAKEKLEGLGAHSPGLRTLTYGLDLSALRPLVDPNLLPEGSLPTNRRKARSNA
ncbi:tyrosine-type recombinase/integrase [Stenotrophomonas maltophilia]|uniref:DUF6538 domain-containing protein n=1 Tax=Stenotrophomonas TaxID=40323 RepID=UPI0007F8F927|nr:MULTISPECIES: DUF6538 domain-containing protein [Stenotrophomonas]MBH1523901.1 tyrosine-type recombinase/integrase [Stenotrophomonas maltophilia]MBH1671987.1 tyrosine-type recombinase/integrase [Stenotrophomonas maltophilia]MBN5154829.1 tyrosine-type recombinase/integrase [Stenotrophomonas maltophilia]MDT3491029.1 tyrosine-type recombinase/integrase [Stenotrophomonas maltophilia group sp. msm4]MDT3556003.1 tyrosine-type recombinase/integrase [Stenotrophomonas maltophilia group sp. msm1]